MTDIRKLIKSVEEHPYVCNAKSYNYADYAKIWKRIADRCQLRDGHEAYKIWCELLENYLEYLRSSAEFQFYREMRFTQSYLIRTSSDSSDIDEAILIDAINHSDDDIDLDIKTYPTKKTKLDETIKVVKENAPTTETIAQLKSSEVLVETATVVATPDNQSKSTAKAELTNLPPANIGGLSSLQLIFLGYAKILQDLPLALQIRTKHKIAQIMNEAELSLIEANDASGENKSTIAN